MLIEPAGSQGTLGETIAWPSLFINGDTPYVAIGDYTDGQKGKLWSYQLGSWVLIGGQAFSSAAAIYPSLYIYQNTPYVAFGDGAHSNKISVRKFTNGNWETVGALGFSNQGVAGGSEKVVSMAVNSQGVPYVAFISNTGSIYQITVMKFE